MTAIYSAITGRPVDNLVAMTGEVSILGHVMPVGGIIPKVKAAKLAGAKRVIIPADNWQETFAEETTIQVIPVRRIEEVIAAALVPGEKKEEERREELPFTPIPKAPLGRCLS